MDAIFSQKGDGGSGGCSFVTINKRLSFREMKSVSSSNFEKAATPIPKRILSRTQSRFNQPRLANTGGAAIPRQRFVMQIQNFGKG